MSGLADDPGIAFIGIGSNSGEPLNQIRSGVNSLDRIDGIDVIARSSLWSNPPVGGPPQPDFVNSVIAVRTTMEPQELLECMLRVELEHGRDRQNSPPNGPRTLDLDLLVHGSRIIEGPSLTLPHPRMHQRAFVLVPLEEIAPDLVNPRTGLSVQSHIREIRDEGLADQFLNLGGMTDL